MTGDPYDVRLKVSELQGFLRGEGVSNMFTWGKYELAENDPYETSRRTLKTSRCG